MPQRRLGAAPAQRVAGVVVEDVGRGGSAVVVPTDRSHAGNLDVVEPSRRIRKTAAPAVGVVRSNGLRHRSGVGRPTPSRDVRIPVGSLCRGCHDASECHSCEQERSTECCEAFLALHDYSFP